AQAFGAEVCMTDSSLPSGTDRLQQVAQRLGFADDAIVVNVQGDEPLIPPQVIDQVAANLAANAEADIATLCVPIGDLEELYNPNAVKVVFGQDGGALYFSRAPIPWPRDAFAPGKATALPTAGAWYRHVGIYAYRARFLHRYVTWPAAPSEQLEQLEQLRALHHGVRIHVALASAVVPGGVDTAADLEQVERLLLEAPARGRQ
ncbi:MAG TPA: 3-deoxy-manno-octulosonate cytidylyltransferase, partial [Kineobactrum sp.]